MNALYKWSACVAGASLLLGFASANVKGQAAPPPSDTVTVSLDGMVPPIAGVVVSESEEGQTFTIPVPGIIIELFEGPSPTAGIISDRMTINPFQIVFASDPPEAAFGVGPRPNAVQVSEHFVPVSINFVSDGETTLNGDLSDWVLALVNGVGSTIGIPESSATGELPLSGLIEAASYDMMESTDGTTVVLSDTLDHSQIQYSFESDATEQGLPPITIPEGFVHFVLPETDPNGSPIVHNVSIIASSDADIPEPSSIVLATVGMLGVAGYLWRRERGAQG